MTIQRAWSTWSSWSTTCAAATAFCVELGLKLQGEAPVEGVWWTAWWGSRTSGGDRDGGDPGRPRTTRADEVPPALRSRGNRNAPANTPGIGHVAFAVEDIDAVVAGLRARGAELVGELERYEDSYRLCYVRGPEGIIVELAEQIG